MLGLQQLRRPQRLPLQLYLRHSGPRAPRSRLNLCPWSSTCFFLIKGLLAAESEEHRIGRATKRHETEKKSDGAIFSLARPQFLSLPKPSVPDRFGPFYRPFLPRGVHATDQLGAQVTFFFKKTKHGTGPKKSEPPWLGRLRSRGGAGGEEAPRRRCLSPPSSSRSLPPRPPSPLQSPSSK